MQIEPIDEPRGCPTPGACSALAEVERLRDAFGVARRAVDDLVGKATNITEYDNMYYVLHLIDQAIGGTP